MTLATAKLAIRETDVMLMVGSIMIYYVYRTEILNKCIVNRSIYNTFSDTCSYNLSPVPCEDAVAGWIFNTDTKMCEFGGCSGRGKIFSTMRECVENCGG